MIVEEGILEVEGVDGETVDVMAQKYSGLDRESLSNFENADGVVEGVGGFRLLRNPRMRERPGEEIPPFMSIQVPASVCRAVCEPQLTDVAGF